MSNFIHLPFDIGFIDELNLKDKETFGSSTTNYRKGVGGTNVSVSLRTFYVTSFIRLDGLSVQ